MNIYTFHRKEGFYPIELPSDEEALRNVRCNPGTIIVVNMTTGKTVFNERKLQS